MRQIVFCLCLMAMLSLCGCFGLGVQYRDQQGRALDWPYGQERVVTTAKFYQHYNGWVAIAVDGDPALTVSYRDSLSVDMTSRKSFKYEVSWDEQVAFNGRIRKVRHIATGLYTGRPVIIDEAFLRNIPGLEIVIDNTSPLAAEFYDSQRHKFILGPMDGVVIRVMAGDYVLNWRPLDGSQQEQSLSVCKMLRPGKKVFWDGNFYDDRIHVDRIKANWRDLQAMRKGGGCIRLY